MRRCRTGQEAVSAVRDTLVGTKPPFDLVLMDVFMPVLDGLGAARQIRDLFGGAPPSHGGCPPIVALTANAFPEDRERCLAAGMDDYIAKPFDPERLEAVLTRWAGATPAPARLPAA